MNSSSTQVSGQRRVVLLETDERSGLVAALAAACANHGVSLEISTGPGHVIITLEAAEPDAVVLWATLKQVPGVNAVHPYAVAEA